MRTQPSPHETTMENEHSRTAPSRPSPARPMGRPAGVGVSSWALHETLDAPPIYGVDAGDTVPDAVREKTDAATVSLLDLPAALAHHGFDSLQICHFHLPTRDHAYLSDLRGAIFAAGLPLHALLIDGGDLTHPDQGARDEDWIARWLPVAARLGAGEVRVIAGKSVGEGSLERAVAALRRLARVAADQGVRLTTENWYPVLSSPAAVIDLLEGCGGEVRFLLDFSNWSRPAKYEDLPEIASYAAACHAQATYLGPLEIDEQDYAFCLDLPYSSALTGGFFLVNSGPHPDPWQGLGVPRDFIKAHTARKQLADPLT